MISCSLQAEKSQISTLFGIRISDSNFGFEIRDSRFEISYLLEAKEALDAASRIIKAFFGDVNDDEAFKGCSSDTLEAADMDRS